MYPFEGVVRSLSRRNRNSGAGSRAILEPSHVLEGNSLCAALLIIIQEMCTGNDMVDRCTSSNLEDLKPSCGNAASELIDSETHSLLTPSHPYCTALKLHMATQAD
jgi:hypothetical protein